MILLLEQAGPSLDLTFQHHPELSESLLSRNKKDTVLLEKRFKQIKDQIRTLYERIKKGEIPEDLNEFHKQVAKYIIEHKLDFVLELENIDFDLWQIEMLKEAFDRIIVQEFYEGDEETYLPLLLKEVSYDRTGVLRRDEALIRQIEEIQSTVPNSMVIALRGSLHSKTGMAEALREKGIPARSVIPGEPASLLLLVPHDEVTIKLIQEDRGPTDKEIDLLLKQIPFDQLGIILTLQDPFARFSLLRGIVDRLNREEIIELSHALSQNGGVGAGPPFIFHWLQEKDKMTHEEAKAFDPRLWEKGKTSPDGGRKEKPWSLIPLYYP
ncbi:MAG: hypothetical protein HY590_07685 [Candidatus Omnitrophica bacterium]|nr:hypothetical protein [Candidatus Omnitrophota bacterium]